MHLVVCIVVLAFLAFLVYQWKDMKKKKGKGSTTSDYKQIDAQDTHVTDQNPYGNPMQYGGVKKYGKPTGPPIETFDQKLYRGTDEIDQDLFHHTIPDPTLVARPVFWNFSPDADVVSGPRDCDYRRCS
jgi:hypothetical protein